MIKYFLVERKQKENGRFSYFLRYFMKIFLIFFDFFVDFCKFFLYVFFGYFFFFFAKKLLFSRVIRCKCSSRRIFNKYFMLF